MQSLDALTASMSSGDMASTRKMAKFQSYTRSVNQTVVVATPPVVITVKATSEGDATT